MANRINIPKTHLIMGLCLPLAVLLGYFLAEPLDSGSMIAVTVVLSLLAVPLMMKWHHPLLVLSWNACIAPVFLPGRPFIWLPMAVGSLLFAILNRSVRAENHFISVPSLTRPLIFLLGVVVLTAGLTGGIHVRSLGSTQHGGKAYFYIMAAVAGYYALTSQRIPSEKAGLYLAMFFLPGLTALVGNLAYAGGPGLYFLFYIFPSGGVEEQVMADFSLHETIVRMHGLTGASLGLSGYLFARYGFRGLLDISKAWRGFFFLLSVAGCIAGGFRSVLILFALMGCILFYLEGLHRTRLLPVCLGVGLAAAAVVFPQADKLPLSVQRSLSFLPANVAPIVQQSAQDSTQWRLQIWRMVLPQVPKYLIKGKGYAFDANDMYMAQESAQRNWTSSMEGAMLPGDYHSGPLSVIVPFGILGVIAFGWFLIAALRYLYYNYRFGSPSLKLVNTFLLAAFIARIILFMVIFGSLYSDLFLFTGLLGLSVSLNGEPQSVSEAEPEAEGALAQASS